LARTRGPTPLGEFDKDAIEVEIIAMTDEEVTAALLSIQKKDVKDVPVPPKGRGKTVTVEDVDSNEDSDDADDANAGDLPRRSTMPPPPAKPARPARPSLLDDIPVIPYKSAKLGRTDLLHEPDPTYLYQHFSPPREFEREATTESMRARRAPVPTIESQTKPPAKFKGEEMSFIKVDVFLKKLERYLRTRHGLDLSTDDITDNVFDSLDEYAYRWFDTLRKETPYLFRHFDRDLCRRYVPHNYKDQLADEYEAVKQGNDCLFMDYLTELRDYEDMLDDVSKRDKYHVLKKGINDDLRKNMVVFEGIPYEDFIEHATRIDPALLKKRQKQENNDKKRERIEAPKHYRNNRGATAPAGQ
jgi:hypothetical protein